MEEKLREIVYWVEEEIQYHGRTRNINRIEELARAMLADLKGDPPRKISDKDSVKDHIIDLWKEIEGLKGGISELQQWRRRYFTSQHDEW